MLLTEAREAERDARWPSGSICLGEVDPLVQPTPARDALLEYLSGQTSATLAGLYALFRPGDYPCSAVEATRRYRYSYELADQPIHHPHAAGDLVAKAWLARGLRRGLEYLGLPPLLHPSQEGDHLHPVTQPED